MIWFLKLPLSNTGFNLLYDVKSPFLELVLWQPALKHLASIIDLIPIPS